MNKKIIALAALALVSLTAQAHRGWLLPSAGAIEGDKPWVTVDAAISEALFDFEHQPLKLDGLTISGPDGAAVNPQNITSSRFRNSFDIELKQPGSYRVSLVNETVMASYKLGSEVKRVRSTPANIDKDIPAGATEVVKSVNVSRLETFVTAGKPTAGVQQPIGKGLELQAISHPNELFAGDKSSFRLLMDGKPVAGVPVSVVRGGVRHSGLLDEQVYTTDAKGEIKVSWKQGGMYWVNASWPKREAMPTPPQGSPAAGSPPPEGGKPGMGGAGGPGMMPMAPFRASYTATLEVLP